MDTKQTTASTSDLFALAAALVVGFVGAPVLLAVRLTRLQVRHGHVRDAWALTTGHPTLSQATSRSRLIGQ
jgi:hypothetical protein